MLCTFIRGYIARPRALFPAVVGGHVVAVFVVAVARFLRGRTEKAMPVRHREMRPPLY